MMVFVDVYFFCFLVCIDVRRRKRYIVGEIFFREDKCCICFDKGINCVLIIVNICY